MQRCDILKLTFATAAVALSACSGAPVGRTDTVLDVAQAHGLTRFAQAVAAADLEETLSGTGPYTVFVPSNRALAAARVPAEADALRRLVAYHVVPGTFPAEFLGGMDVNYTTAAGSSLNVDGTGGGLRVNGANVVEADLEAGNGVVHVIDRVLVPR